MQEHIKLMKGTSSNNEVQKKSNTNRICKAMHPLMNRQE
ncbi:hypothetical protein ig2599ANME_2257 [groundwater metagenome]